MTHGSTFTVDRATVDDFLSGHRFAVVGASADEKNFGTTVLRALKDHGYEVVAVHPSDTEVAGEAAYPDVASVPGELDGVIVMVRAEPAVGVVEQCAERGVDKVWLFRGLGGDGATSDESVRRCHDLGLDVVAGACPMMFLEPVAWVHRLHRSARSHRGMLVTSA